MNFKMVPGDKFGATRMKYRIDRLKAESGLSKQAIIFKLLALGWEALHEYGEAKARIDEEWEKKTGNK